MVVKSCNDKKKILAAPGGGAACWPPSHSQLTGGAALSLPPPQALGFRCAHCTSEFGTRRAMDDETRNS
jgi:hypothetical protein